MEWKKELQKAVKEGRAVLGLKRTIKLLKKGEGKMVVVASSCPAKEQIAHYAKVAGLELVEFAGDGYELGATVRKPFSVSTVLVK